MLVSFTKDYFRAQKMTQLAKYLPQKHKDLNMIFTIHVIKLGIMCFSCHSTRDAGVGRTHWPAQYNQGIPSQMKECVHDNIS